MHNSDYFVLFLAALAAIAIALRLTRSLETRRAIVALGSTVVYYELDPQGLPVCLGLVAINWGLGRAFVLSPNHRKTTILVFGLTLNLGLLAAYKYLGTLVAGLGATYSVELGLGFPIGLSFIVFRLVSYLVDAHGGGKIAQSPLDLLSYALFFPSILCGPLVRYDALTSQDRLGRTTSVDWSVGLALIGIGMFKNLVISPAVALVADKVMIPWLAKQPIPTSSAWVGMIAYGFQVYFDFSGYSDAAIGVARLLGVELPANFHSPFKARSMVDFWQRWHVSLTRFLTIYVYNTVTLDMARRIGAKASAAKQFVWRIAYPTTLVMFLMGIWHGNHLTFAMFGLYHASLLVVNHAWRSFGGHYRKAALATSWWPTVALGLTFFSVAAGWAIFRASNPGRAFAMLGTLLGRSEWTGGTLLTGAWPTQLADPVLSTGGTMPLTVADLAILLLLFLIVWGLPNSNQILSRFNPVLEGGGYPKIAPSAEALKLSLSPVWAVSVSCLLVWSALAYLSNDRAALLYFHF
ncbi:MULTISPECIES: MBOAT family O-acyltransferase [unclassified Bradyrhizobium]|uniref:MBOAT family O-acyltransferase n=1 Tax=unclassified Bradyrhizobium TaxID=2631580 RepID=UPI0028ED1BC9|nr:MULTISPECIES: MBOAT family O-acyltransferase [unclassified Bradyrhizobium]